MLVQRFLKYMKARGTATTIPAINTWKQILIVTSFFRLQLEQLAWIGASETNSNAIRRTILWKCWVRLSYPNLRERVIQQTLFHLILLKRMTVELTQTPLTN
jgi:hypothetical protein